jgi:hypothetical protein
MTRHDEGGKKFAETEKDEALKVLCEDDTQGFFNTESIVHCEFLPAGQTINVAY